VWCADGEPGRFDAIGEMRVLGGTIPRMVLAEMVEDLIRDQDPIGVGATRRAKLI
jgi:hypothetical protein